MRIASRHDGYARVRAFSLVELLLTIVLLMLLLGALVFNFANLTQGAALKEGSDRFMTMLRFARAHAALHGRLVQLEIAREEGLTPADRGRSFRLLWEPEPLREPGAMKPLNASAWDMKALNQQVGVSSVEVPRTLLGRGMPQRTSTMAASSAQESGAGEAGAAPDTITFYPDGSSDAAMLVLVSRDGEDARQLRMRLEGWTGMVETAWLPPESEEGEGQAEDEFQDGEEEGELESLPSEAAL